MGYTKALQMHDAAVKCMRHHEDPWGAMMFAEASVQLYMQVQSPIGAKVAFDLWLKALDRTQVVSPRTTPKRGKAVI